MEIYLNEHAEKVLSNLGLLAMCLGMFALTAWGMYLDRNRSK
jgi:hypothetical protein